MIVLFACAIAGAASPEEAVHAALQQHPALAAAEAERRAAEGAWQASRGVRFNPRLSLAADLSGRRASAAWTQDLSLSGAGWMAARAGRLGWEAADAALAQARIEVAAEARLAWSRLAAAEGVLQAAEGEWSSAREVREATERRREAGDAADLELGLARLAEARAVARWMEAWSERAGAQAALAAITGDPEVEAIGDPLAAAPVAGGGGERADLRAARARVEAASARLAQERAEALPAVGLGLAFEREEDFMGWSPQLQLELPLWQRNPAGRAAAEGALWRAERDATAARARAEVEQRTGRESLRALSADGLRVDEVREAVEVVLAGVEAALSAGQLDPAQAALLRAQAFDGQRGWYAARLAEAELRIAAARANAEPGLLSP